ncbi:prephenate dehydrogenase [Candidatus Izemoplasma sp. B36]|uniref:prephenate dehydrogenase n=1 Tax=Candidatus Izemoplasma sp. B36 TaxID=3242468 RepID=UPI003555F2AE
MNIGIVGLGLIGGTIAKSLKNKHYITGYDISKDTIDYALENNIIQKAYNNLNDFFNDNDIIFLCLYPKSMINFIFRNKDIFPKYSIIIEFSGIKKSVISEIESINLDNVDIIYAHPIAGSEKVGIKHSNEYIFDKANFVITPVETNKKGNIDLAISLAKEMGFKNVSLITPSDHDDIIAYTSQLTHVLSLSLVNSLSSTLDTSKFIGDSYRDLTRISMINEKLWPELFIKNKAALLNKIESFESELKAFKGAITAEDYKKLEEMMVKSTTIRSKIAKGDKNDS